MRTKTLLLIGAAAAAGLVSSQAQVFSVNAVGYVNKVVPANGFSLISNPLNAQTNTVASLFSGQVPSGFAVYVWDTTAKSFKFAQYDTEFGWDPADVAATELSPGQGLFVKAPAGNAVTVTFVGEVPQGNLSQTLVPGLQIVSSKVPQQGKLATDLAFTPEGGDRIFQWDASKQTYNFFSFDSEFGWDPAEPTLDVGDAIFLQKADNAKTLAWARTFNVNQ
jgi:hypothetical protein